MQSCDEAHGFSFHQHLKIAKCVELHTLFLPGVEQARALQNVLNIVTVKGLEDHIVRLHLKRFNGKARVRGDEDDDDIPPDFP